MVTKWELSTMLLNLAYRVSQLEGCVEHLTGHHPASLWWGSPAAGRQRRTRGRGVMAQTSGTLPALYDNVKKTAPKPPRKPKR